MATCRRCQLIRPVNAQGVCSSCIRFHGEHCRTPAQHTIKCPLQRQKTSKPGAASEPDHDGTFTFADLFEMAESRKHAPQPQPHPPHASQEDALRALQRCLPRLQTRQKDTPVACPVSPAPSPDRERVLTQARAGHLSIEQLRKVLGCIGYYQFSLEDCALLKERLNTQLMQRGPIQHTSALSDRTPRQACQPDHTTAPLASLPYRPHRSPVMKELIFLVTGMVVGGLIARNVADRKQLERELERERERNSR